MDMTGKTVLITGASGGIGAETARVFAAAGANVGLIARRQDKIDAVAAEIGSQALALPCDIATYAAVDTAVQKTVSHFGGLDVLINNAGAIEPISPIATADPDDWGGVIDVNIKGVFYGMRAAVPVMRANGGTVLTISSGAASRPINAWSHYCASKAAAAMLTRCLDTEEAENGIRAIGLSPGTVATDMQREIIASGIDPDRRPAWEDHVPADWPARALLWMCSSDADIYHGQEISLRDVSIRKQVGLI